MFWKLSCSSDWPPIHGTSLVSASKVLGLQARANLSNYQTNCMCALVCDHVHACASTCEDQRLTSSVFLCHSPHYCLRQSLSLNLELTCLLVWLASGAQELPVFSSLQWAFRQSPLCVAFDEDTGDPAEVLMLVQQALYLLRHLPSSSL